MDGQVAIQKFKVKCKSCSEIVMRAVQAKEAVCFDCRTLRKNQYSKKRKRSLGLRGSAK